MPHHWFLIDPDNPGPRQRAGAVRKIVRKHGGSLIFVGREPGAPKKWYALVHLKEDDDRTLRALRDEVGVKEDVVLEEVSADEDSP